VPPSTDRTLTVAVTGPTGTFGSGLVPLLQAADRIARALLAHYRGGEPAAEFDPSLPPTLPKGR